MAARTVGMQPLTAEWRLETGVLSPRKPSRSPPTVTSTSPSRMLQTPRGSL